MEYSLDLDALPDMRIQSKHAPELADIAQRLSEVEEELREMHEDVQSEWNSCSKNTKDSKIRFEKHKEHGHIMRLPNANEEQALRKEIPQVVIVSILKNGVYFTTQEMQEKAEELAACEEEYVEAQQAVADKVIQTAATFVPVVESTARVVAELDVFLSFAHVAAHNPGGEYVRPKLHGGAAERIKLIGARHPCVEMQDGISFIGNDYEFERESSRFQIVTGPNMGGKSTFIRGLGSIAVMAQAGCFVPATEAELPIFDTVLARVGAGDAQQRGLSTFMAEMIEASAIVRTATDRSLVIIDELGRGTSTFDGFGLAWAISQYLLEEKRCWTLFATHFHELTSMANGERAVVNKHVSAHVETGTNAVTFLFEVLPGPCLDSYGIHVAQMAHFPKSVIKAARVKASELEGGPAKVRHEHYRTATTIYPFHTSPPLSPPPRASSRAHSTPSRAPLESPPNSPTEPVSQSGPSASSDRTPRLRWW